MATVTGLVKHDRSGPANFWNLFRRAAQMATKGAEYKVRRGLFDLRPLIP